MPPSHSVYDVFTPSTQARLNFIDRASIDPQLMDAINTPGKQLIVYGESGCGKSTLLTNKLDATYAAYITTRCSKAMTYQQLLLDAFDQLDPFYTQGRSTTSSKGVTPALQTAFISIRASISKAEGEQQNRALPPQLTAQRLAEFLGAKSMCWVVEDFHKMPQAEKVPFAQSLKIFSDVSTEYPDVMVIAVGATDTAREVVEYDPEMSNRVSELFVPPMTSEELNGILEKGQNLLNVNFSAVAEGIVDYSLGMPSTCHQLALSTCLETGVMSTQKVRRAFNWRDLDPALQRWVADSSDTIQAKLFRALGRQVRGKYENCSIILAAVASGPLTGMTFDQVLTKIRTEFPDYPERNLHRYLRELTKNERGQLLKAVDGRVWRFTSAMYHSILRARLSKTYQTAASPSPELYVEQVVARSWADALYSSPKLANTVFSDAAGTYHFDMINYFEPLVTMVGGSNIQTGATYIGFSDIPLPKKPVLYEAPARRTRKHK